MTLSVPAINSKMATKAARPIPLISNLLSSTEPSRDSLSPSSCSGVESPELVFAQALDSDLARHHLNRVIVARLGSPTFVVGGGSHHRADDPEQREDDPHPEEDEVALAKGQRPEGDQQHEVDSSKEHQHQSTPLVWVERIWAFAASNSAGLRSPLRRRALSRSKASTSEAPVSTDGCERPDQRWRRCPPTSPRTAFGNSRRVWRRRTSAPAAKRIAKSRMPSGLRKAAIGAQAIRAMKMASAKTKAAPGCSRRYGAVSRRIPLASRVGPASQAPRKTRTPKAIAEVATVTRSEVPISQTASAARFAASLEASAPTTSLPATLRTISARAPAKTKPRPTERSALRRRGPAR